MQMTNAHFAFLIKDQQMKCLTGVSFCHYKAG